MRVAILSIIFICFAVLAKSQSNTNNTVKGIIVKAATDSSLAFVHIRNETNNYGAISDENGFFEIPANVGDTLLFSSIGYEKLQFTVDSFSQALKVELVIDITLLPESVILPIPKNTLLLRHALGNLEIRDSTDILKDNMEKAGFKAPPIHPVKPKVTPLNPASFIWEKIVEPIKERKIKKDKVDEMPKLE